MKSVTESGPTDVQQTLTISKDMDAKIAAASTCERMKSIPLTVFVLTKKMVRKDAFATIKTTAS
jgi:hypothetical protein